MALMRDLPKRLGDSPAMARGINAQVMKGRSQLHEGVSEVFGDQLENCGRLYMSPRQLVVLISGEPLPGSDEEKNNALWHRRKIFPMPVTTAVRLRRAANGNQGDLGVLLYDGET